MCRHNTLRFNSIILSHFPAGIHMFIKFRISAFYCFACYLRNQLMRLKMSVTTVSLRSPDNLIRPHFRLFFWKIIHHEKHFSGIRCQKYSGRFNVWRALLESDKPFGNQILALPSTTVLNSDPYTLFVILVYNGAFLPC